MQMGVCVNLNILLMWKSERIFIFKDYLELMAFCSIRLDKETKDPK
jgi:hypothetical protein